MLKFSVKEEFLRTIKKPANSLSTTKSEKQKSWRREDSYRGSKTYSISGACCKPRYWKIETLEKVFNNNNALWKVCILQGKNVFERQQRCVERPGRDQGESHCSGAEAATAVMQLLASASASATINHSQPVPISTSFTLSQCQILNPCHIPWSPTSISNHYQPSPSCSCLTTINHCCSEPLPFSTIAIYVLLLPTITQCHPTQCLP